MVPTGEVLLNTKFRETRGVQGEIQRCFKQCQHFGEIESFTMHKMMKPASVQEQLECMVSQLQVKDDITRYGGTSEDLTESPRMTNECFKILKQGKRKITSPNVMA